MRCYYAVLDNDVYSFVRKRIRDEFCRQKGAKAIYAYERHKYNTSINASQTYKNTLKSNETVQSDRISVKTQNSVDRSISERRKMFKGQR